MGAGATIPHDFCSEIIKGDRTNCVKKTIVLNEDSVQIDALYFNGMLSSASLCLYGVLAPLKS